MEAIRLSGFTFTNFHTSRSFQKKMVNFSVRTTSPQPLTCALSVKAVCFESMEAFHLSGISFNNFHASRRFQKKTISFSVRSTSSKPRVSTSTLSVKAVCFDKDKWDGPPRRKPVEELYSILVEKNISERRQEELRIHRWNEWETARCSFKHKWKVDQLVYIVKGSVRVTPVGSVTSAFFHTGDLVRYPKWLYALLDFEGLYEERYSFVAYGDE